MTIKTILSQKGDDVITIAPDASLAKAAQMLAEHRIGALIVTDSDKRVGGIISERDIVRAVAAGGAAALDQRVQEVMTHKVVTCNTAVGVAEIMEKMTAGKFRHVPVVELGRLVGIISIGDVVKAQLDEYEGEIETLHTRVEKG
jgi:CBS domain-containing protein